MSRGVDGGVCVGWGLYMCVGGKGAVRNHKTCSKKALSFKKLHNPILQLLFFNIICFIFLRRNCPVCRESFADKLSIVHSYKTNF